LAYAILCKNMHKPAPIYGRGKVCAEIISQDGKKIWGGKKKRGGGRSATPFLSAQKMSSKFPPVQTE
jgi:hypothetical protein